MVDCEGEYSEGAGRAECDRDDLVHNGVEDA